MKKVDFDFGGMDPSSPRSHVGRELSYENHEW